MSTRSDHRDRLWTWSQVLLVCGIILVAFGAVVGAFTVHDIPRNSATSVGAWDKVRTFASVALAWVFPGVVLISGGFLLQALLVGPDDEDLDDLDDVGAAEEPEVSET